jgi:Tfp pilus assembly protein PilN
MKTTTVLLLLFTACLGCAVLDLQGKMRALQKEHEARITQLETQLGLLSQHKHMAAD